MNMLHSLISRHLLHAPETPPSPRRRSTHWRSTVAKGLTRAAAAAGKSIDAALGHRAVNKHIRRRHSHDASASPHGDTDDDDFYVSLERTLPPNHPHNIRVRRMADNLIAAACDDETYAGAGRRRRSPLDRIQRPFYGVDWTVNVFDDDHVSAFSSMEGNIWVSTGFIGYMKKDAYIATVLGHEIGHVIARHSWKEFRNHFWVDVLVNMTTDFLDLPRDRVTEDKWESIFMRPCWYRIEYEADHLGMLLLAAAGYDPRIAPPLYEKLAELENDDIFSTHPPSMKRAQRLSQAKVMDEALELYAQALRSGKPTEALDSWSSAFRHQLSWYQFLSGKW